MQSSFILIIIPMIACLDYFNSYLNQGCVCDKTKTVSLTKHRCCFEGLKKPGIIILKNFMGRFKDKIKEMLTLNNKNTFFILLSFIIWCSSPSSYYNSCYIMYIHESCRVDLSLFSLLSNTMLRQILLLFLF